MLKWLKAYRRRIRRRQRETLARGPIFGSGQGRSATENAETAEALFAGCVCSIVAALVALILAAT